MKIRQYIEKHAKDMPDHPAILNAGSGNVITYSDLYEIVAEKCRSSDISKDETLHVINKKSDTELVLEMLCCGFMEKVYFCASPFITSVQLEQQLNFINQHFYQKTDGYQIRVSSGTTDLAKFFYSTQFDRLHHAGIIKQKLEMKPRDLVLSLGTPFNVGLGDSTVVRTLISGATLLVPDSLDIFQNLLHIIRHKPSIIFSTSAVLSKVRLLPKIEMLLSSGAAGNLSPRVWDVGGGPLNHDHAYDIERLISGIVIQHCNRADTAEPHMCDIHDPQEKRITTVGKPQHVKLDQTGEILVEGKYAVERLGYKLLLEDGFYRTGDLGMVDEDGYLCITGRKKLLLSQGGHDINPLEIERVAKKVQGIIDACCVGVMLDEPQQIQHPFLFIETDHHDIVQNVLDAVSEELNINVRHCKICQLPYIRPGKINREQLTNLANVYIQNNK